MRTTTQGRGRLGDAPDRAPDAETTRGGGPWAVAWRKLICWGCPHVRRGASAVVGVALVLAGAVAPALAKDDGPPEKQPGPDATGKVYTWKAEDGLAYDFHLPKDYDPERGITLTFILHGSNGWKGWGFSMHAAGEFRPHDFVVSPDGTTPNGQGGFNSLQSSKDLARFHALHTELRELVKVNATYVYGLSQGSFFAHYYAGHHPEDVQGIVAHGSGLWIGSGLAKNNHHQAIAVMHGRGDPVYPYGGGVAAHEGYVEADYPLLKLRALELDLHWAPWGHQQQQLAWCEGMTTSDPERLAQNLAILTELKDSTGWFRDPVALYQVAKRATELDGVDAKTKKAAGKLVTDVEQLAQAHVDAITKDHAKTKGAITKKATWPAHAHYFLRDWRGVPAADAFADDWEKTIADHADASGDAWKEWDKAWKKDKPDKAFAAGLDCLEEGFLHYWAADAELRKRLTEMRDDPDAHDLGKRLIKRYDEVAKPLLDGWDDGKSEYAKLNKRL